MFTAEGQKSSSSISTRSRYDVFLSFRGKDTRTGFTDHLYTALVKAGFQTFRDDDEITAGGNIASELRRAVRESRVSVVVFSKDYASSRWCLDELVQIMERKRIDQHCVMPVFYKVNAGHVKYLCGDFAAAFAKHEKHPESETDRVQSWRTALREAADLSGFVLGNRLESGFIQDIVEAIQKILDQQALHVPPYLVGTEDLVNEINQWIQYKTDEVGVATVFGIGGIGKTTVAKIVYNSNFKNFEGSSFLANIREVSGEANGLSRLQEQLLSDLSERRDVTIRNPDKGILKIKNVIRSKRVLVVLDDVDDADQFDAIIGIREWFYSGSKIIVTARDQKLLRAYGACANFHVRELSNEESLRLLCYHAFGLDHPTEGYIECSEWVAKRCGGLPLALKVIGSSLFGKSLDTWEAAFQELEVIVDSKIQTILVMGYKFLQHHRDKSLFIDIACFFVGMDKDHTIRILNGLGFSAAVGIQNLVDRCLLFVDSDNKIGMHQMIRDMGREIVRQESPEDPGKRSRLWHSKDVLDVLRCDTGTETIKGLSLDLGLAKEFHYRKNMTTRVAKRSRCEEYASVNKRLCLGLSSWRPIRAVLKLLCPESKEEKLQTRAFRNIHMLKLLRLNYVELSGSYKEFPRSLVWLSWNGFPHESLPKFFCLKNLVAVELCDSRLKYNWKCGQVLGKLKILDLSRCRSLLKTPDLFGLPSLERLILKGCVHLAEIDDSIANLEKLVFLDLSGCRNLRKLSKKIGMLKYLEELDLSHCSMLEKPPLVELGTMDKLKVLRLDRISLSLNELVCAIRDPTKLVTFLLQSLCSILRSCLPCSKIAKSVRTSVAFTSSSLVKLRLAHCNLSENAIAIDFSRMCSLEMLDLKGNPLRKLPQGVSRLRKLQTLTLNGCREIQVIELPAALEELWVVSCGSLERVMNLPQSRKISFYHHGTKMVEVEGFYKLRMFTGRDAEIISHLGLFKLESYRSLPLCTRVQKVKQKRHLEVLHEYGISSLFVPGTSIPDWYQLQRLGPSISFVMPPCETGGKVSGMNVCMVIDCSIKGPFTVTAGVQDNAIDREVAIGEKLRSSRLIQPAITFTNITKGKKWWYSPSFCGKPRYGEDMLWLSHWKVNDTSLQAGDTVSIESGLKYYMFRVKGCGVHVVYEEGGEAAESEYTGQLSTRSAPNWHGALRYFQRSDQNLFLELKYDQNLS